MLQSLPIYLSHREFTPPPAYSREGAEQCTHNRCADRAKQCALRAELRTDRAGACGDKAETGSSLPPSRYFEMHHHHDGARHNGCVPYRRVAT